MTELSPIRLSICIPTYNRAHFIDETIESIISQMTDECELVISDDASTDDTEKVVARYLGTSSRISYIRQPTNLGCDGNIDQAVRLGRGEYCWIMPDDDWMKDNALSTVLDALSGNYSLVVVNKEIRDGSMRDVLVPSYAGIDADTVYLPREIDRLLLEAGRLLMYCGSVVIKRSIWISRATTRYYGTSFVQVGVVFEAPLPDSALLLAQPLIAFRHSLAHGWLSSAFEIGMFRLPSLVWSLAPSEFAKRKFVSPEPWRQFGKLLFWRGLGLYSLREYRRLIRPHTHTFFQASVPVAAALIPRVLANTLSTLWHSVRRDRLKKVSLQWLKESPSSPSNWLRIYHDASR